MGDILVADGNGLFIGISVVIAVGKAEAASFGECDYVLRILEVLVGTEAEEKASALQRSMQTREHGGQVFGGSHGRDLLEIWLKRFGAELVDGGFVHTSAEVVADFLLVGVATVGLLG